MVSRRTSFVRVVLVALALLLLLPGTHAEEIPFGRLQIDLQANNEPLNAFLARLLTLAGIPSTMTPAVSTAKVNGRIRGHAQTVFRELAETFGFTWYYNGSLVYVCGLGELESRMLHVSPADVPRIERAMAEMRLLDSRFPLRTSVTEGQVLVSGPMPYVDVVNDIVNRIAGAPSQPVRAFDTRVFRLRYARAADTTTTIAGIETMIPGVARILNETFGATRSAAPPAPSRNMPVTVPGLRGKGLVAVGQPDGAMGGEVRGTGGTSVVAAGPATSEPASVDTLRVRNPVQAPRAVPEPVAPLGPLEAVIRAEPRINAVIVRDAPERMEMYARLIAQLDISTPLVEIEATVVDVSHDKSERLGIDWRLHGRRGDLVSSPNGLATNGAGTMPPNNANGLLYQLPALSAGSGLVGTLLFGSERTNFVARLSALTESGDANLISKPRVLTLDNKEAVLQSTQDFYVRVAGREQVDLFNVTLGLVLRVTPTLILEDGGASIKLNVRIEDGNTDTGAQVDQIPVVNRNAISTEAVVGDGQTLLIGGYTVDEKRRDNSGVPVLSEVPGLRWLFGQKSTTNKRMERMFMITPRIVKPEDLRTSALDQPSALRESGGREATGAEATR